MAKQDDYIKTALRLPSDLHARIQQAAESSGRSMNAELINRLLVSFEQKHVVEVQLVVDRETTMGHVSDVMKTVMAKIGGAATLEQTIVFTGLTPEESKKIAGH